jgi:hypothetical protein
MKYRMQIRSAKYEVKANYGLGLVLLVGCGDLEACRIWIQAGLKQMKKMQV